MKKQLEVIRKTRQAILALIEPLSAGELNQVPSGFNNNIIWNIAHLVAAQENIFYAKAGLNINVDQSFFDAYKPGSKPERHLSNTEIATIKQLLLSSVDQLESDLQKNIFKEYQPWTTRYGVEMNSFEDALTLLPFHEGLHFGYVMAMKRALAASV